MCSDARGLWPVAVWLQVTTCETTAEAEAFHAAEAGRTLTPPLSAESAAELGPLELQNTLTLELRPNAHAADVAISGLGWVGVSSLATLRKATSMSVTLDVWAPRGVKVSLRPPMPVGGLPI